MKPAVTVKQSNFAILLTDGRGEQKITATAPLYCTLFANIEINRAHEFTVQQNSFIRR